MRYQWINDLITFQEIETTHGAEVVRLLQDRWFGDEGLLLYAQEEPEGSNKRAEAGPSEPGTRRRREAAQTSATCKPDEETEESSHLALTLAIQAVVTQATWEGRAREYESLEVRLARDQLGRLRREGWTLREQASALYVLVQARNDGDYSDHFPTMMMELDLPVDVNLSPSCLPAACPVLTWIEAEMWDRFVDWFEGMIGAETESLQRIRDQPNMAAETRADWRDWAQAATTSRSTPPRSRSPRRPLSRAPGEDQDDRDGGSDVTSLMYTGNRGSSWENTRRRARRRSTTRPRERSRDRRWERPTASARDERVRQRITGETRRLVPRDLHAEPEPEGRCEDNSTGGRATSSRDGMPDTTGTGLSRPGEVEIDIVQATGRWTRLIGLRGPGEYQQEPSNAILKRRQNEARRELRTMGEANLTVMYRALMRLMG